MLLISKKFKRNGNTIEAIPYHVEVVGEIPDAPRYYDAICEVILPGIIEAGILPQVKKITSKAADVEDTKA